jgi:glycine/D-amino acid oxidase-like deaminating enzyme
VDVLVVGAGIIGLSSAYHIKRLNPGKSVLVIDKHSAAGQGNTAKSVACFRNVFSSKTNFLLADSSVDYYMHVQNELKRDLDLHMIGYLFLFSEAGYKNNLEAFKKMKLAGVEFELFEKEELEKMIPGAVLEFSEDDEEAEMLGLENVSMGVLGKKCGYLDVDELVKFYEEEFKKLGGLTQYNTLASKMILEPKKKLRIPGEPFVWQDSRVVGVETNRGEIRAETLVVATGVWTTELLNPIGVDSHIRPKKRQIFTVKGPSLEPLFNIRGFNKEGILPFTILPKAHMYFRPDIGERSCWVGCADELGRKFELEEDPQPEEDYYLKNIYLVLRKYFPHFEDLRPSGAWAGQYAMNTIDANPYIFEEAGMILVVGLSGSGIIKADAVGRVAAALYMDEEYAELFGGRSFKVSDLSVKKRKVDMETFVI